MSGTAGKIVHIKQFEHVKPLSKCAYYYLYKLITSLNEPIQFHSPTSPISTGGIVLVPLFLTNTETSLRLRFFLKTLIESIVYQYKITHPLPIFIRNAHSKFQITEARKFPPGTSLIHNTTLVASLLSLPKKRKTTQEDTGKKPSLLSGNVSTLS